MVSNVIDQLREHINNGNNFLLSGGAGSGKTYTLMQVLDIIHEKDPAANIACITYTNVAADEKLF
ncbi:MAG: UvrD-helicase domain-containing protein [Anaerovoracaceae bacterium]